MKSPHDVYEVLSETHGDSKPNAQRFNGKDSAIRGAMLGGVFWGTTYILNHVNPGWIRVESGLNHVIM